ncbi:hypothetical protein F5Y16DRAFT_339853 [Xylariaceae sp. FL0255]|nr:hypothetical protein F5Y16DRAFT_339853 [Xylariaceae sp. FL0255]
MSKNTAPSLFTALIRTHHITSRKKVQRVRKAASQWALPFVLIRSGGAPGIMYAEGSCDGVTSWVNFVASLRYKDYRCLRRPALNEVLVPPPLIEKSFEEVETTAEFARRMEERGLETWWRSAMDQKPGVIRDV